MSTGLFEATINILDLQMTTAFIVVKMTQLNILCSGANNSALSLILNKDNLVKQMTKYDRNWGLIHAMIKNITTKKYMEMNFKGKISDSENDQAPI